MTITVLWEILAFLVAGFNFNESPVVLTCPEGFTLCPSMTGQCYHTTDKCDKLQWCKYSLADYIAVCQGPVDEGFQKCKDGYHWYPIKQACNYHNWCTDKTDEDPDMCKAFLCPEGTVKCNDGRHCGVNQSRCDYAKEMANK